MISRNIQPVVERRLVAFPAVALLGSRQVGKTTLAKSMGGKYFDLEVEEEVLRLDLLWDEVVSGDELVILDEAQNLPSVFPRLRSAIDADRKRCGRFLILGSVSPALMKEVSESLAGRVAICEMEPLSCRELKADQQDSLWYHGGYPDGGVLGDDQYPVWQKNYLDLMALRDLPNWGLSAKPAVTQRFFRMLAAVHGAEWNASALGSSLGITYHTVNGYLDYLEQAYLIRRLVPYHANIKKRLVKRPKVYWRDSGLHHSLMRLGKWDELFVQPWVGASFEGFIIEQILRHLASRDLHYDGPYYLRTSDGTEIDLLFKIDSQFFAVEIKLTTQPKREMLAKLSSIAEQIGATQQVLISRSTHEIKKKNQLITNLAGFLSHLDTCF